MLGLIWDRESEDWKRYDSEVDESGNVEIVEVPAFASGARSEAVAAHTVWMRSNR